MASYEVTMSAMGIETVLHCSSIWRHARPLKSEFLKLIKQ
jgi:hypothetical protein